MPILLVAQDFIFVLFNTLNCSTPVYWTIQFDTISLSITCAPYYSKLFYLICLWLYTFWFMISIIGILQSSFTSYIFDDWPSYNSTMIRIFTEIFILKNLLVPHQIVAKFNWLCLCYLILSFTFLLLSSLSLFSLSKSYPNHTTIYIYRSITRVI